MVQMSRLDADKDKEDIIWLVIDSYMNYDKILENQLDHRAEYAGHTEQAG